MQVARIPFEGLDPDFPEFDTIIGNPTYETSTPINGRSSVKFNCANVEALHLILPTTTVFLYYIGIWFQYSNTLAANGLLQWLAGTTSRGDLRLHTSGRIEGRIDGTLVGTGRRILQSGTTYHLQLHLALSSAYQFLQIKLNDSNLFDLNYFNRGPISTDVTAFRIGPFNGAGSGTLLMDDFCINNTVSIASNNARDISWTGPLAITASEPIGVGTGITNQWLPSGAATIHEATDERPHDFDSTLASSITHLHRQAVVFSAPPQIPNAILEAVGFKAVASSFGVTGESSVKLRFRRNISLTNEVWTISISGVPTAGDWQFSYGGETSALLAHNVSISIVQLQADVFWLGHCTVSGTPGQFYIFTFSGQYSQTRLLNIGVVGTFTGGTDPEISIARTTPGEGIYEQGIPLNYYDTDPPDPDALGDPYSESLTSTYRVKSVRRTRPPHGVTNPANRLIWNKATADQYELLMQLHMRDDVAAQPGELGESDTNNLLNAPDPSAFISP